MTGEIVTLKVLVAEEDYAIDLHDWKTLRSEERVKAQLDANNPDVDFIFIQTWYVKQNESFLQASLNELLGRSWVVIAWTENYVSESLLKEAENKLTWAQYVGKGPKHLGDV